MLRPPRRMEAAREQEHTTYVEDAKRERRKLE
jgi:hypothetical protein